MTFNPDLLLTEPEHVFIRACQMTRILDPHVMLGTWVSLQSPMCSRLCHQTLADKRGREQNIYLGNLSY